MISIGAIVTVKQFGAQLWVVKAPASGGGAWYLSTKGTDPRGRATYSGHRAGSGDITVVVEAASYAVGSTVRHSGLDHIVIEDRFDEVELGVPARRVPTQDPSSFVRIPSGNVTTVSKADLALEQMQTTETE